MMKKTVTVKFYDVEFKTDFNTDCGGGGFQWKCPDCEETVSWAPHMWWRLECRCREWDFTVKIKGTLKGGE